VPKPGALRPSKIPEMRLPIQNRDCVFGIWFLISEEIFMVFYSRLASCFL
jgi:hypothetical protein